MLKVQNRKKNISLVYIFFQERIWKNNNDNKYVNKFHVMKCEKMLDF